MENNLELSNELLSDEIIELDFELNEQEFEINTLFSFEGEPTNDLDGNNSLNIDDYWRVYGPSQSELNDLFENIDLEYVPGNSEQTPVQIDLDIASLDGSGNNLSNPNWGVAGTIYRRLGSANYADGIGKIDNTLPNARFVSNLIFNDLHINLFSENKTTHWSFVWGQFLDHTFGLAQGGRERANIAFDSNSPLEDFRNDLGYISFNRTPDAGVDTQREQINTVSSFIDGWAIYGGTESRLEWLREGVVDGDMSNNSAKLYLPGGYLPRANDPNRVGVPAPGMAIMGHLQANPGNAAVAGDVRANENSGLTAVHTIFAREHNRIVDLLPEYLDEETKFQIARKIVIAEQQYITYNEFLPAMGVDIAQYQGYDSTVNPSITNEFASVGYRAHSQIHGDFDFKDVISDADKQALIKIGALDDGGNIKIPLNAAFGNPNIVPMFGLEAISEGLADGKGYYNDAQIDNQLRSILFQLPKTFFPGVTDGGGIEGLFNIVQDLGAIDLQRGRDHGMPSYNELRQIYGLDPVDDFYDITGEDIDAIKALVDSEGLKDLDGSIITSDELIFDADDLNLNDPSIIQFIAVMDEDGKVIADAKEIAETIAQGEEIDGITSLQRSTMAARLEAIYDGDIDRVDAFVGMVAEKHLLNSDFGELQHAIWKHQFEVLRDGDRFFYGNDHDLAEIKAAFGINYQHTFADIIAFNTNLEVGDLKGNIFLLDGGMNDVAEV